MLGYVVFGLFCLAMVVLAGFVISFSVRLGRQRRTAGGEGNGLRARRRGGSPGRSR